MPSITYSPRGNSVSSHRYWRGHAVGVGELFRFGRGPVFRVKVVSHLDAQQFSAYRYFAETRWDTSGVVVETNLTGK